MPLAPRLMLYLLVPIALCFAAYGYANVQLQRRELLSEAAKEVRDHGTVLGISLDVFLRDRDMADLDELTADLTRADRILGILIFDAEDRSVQASPSVTSYRDTFRAAARRARTERRPNASTHELDGRDVYAYAFPIGHHGSVPRGGAVLLRDLDYVRENTTRSAEGTAVAGIIVMIVVALGTWIGVRAGVLRPLSALTSGVARVATGVLDAEVPVPRNDELGRVATSFNNMTASLRDSRDAQRALENRLRHAQRLALVGQLSANLAHQIGSPLNVILGRATYALQQGGQSERDARHFAEIVAGAESISHVIEKLLSQARRVRGPDGPIDVGELVAGTARFLAAECERSRITVVLDIEPGVVVDGARDELEQVVLNLCVNAIQAQPRGGKLELEVRRAEGSVGPTASITIADRGPGIPAADRQRIFEAFYTTKPPSEGTGLGLAICDELVRSRGGTIVVSDRDGGGAAFQVTLPLATHRITPAATHDTKVRRPV